MNFTSKTYIRTSFEGLGSIFADNCVTSEELIEHVGQITVTSAVS